MSYLQETYNGVTSAATPSLRGRLLQNSNDDDSDGYVTFTAVIGGALIVLAVIGSVYACFYMRWSRREAFEAARRQEEEHRHETASRDRDDSQNQSQGQGDASKASIRATARPEPVNASPPTQQPGGAAGTLEPTRAAALGAMSVPAAAATATTEAHEEEAPGRAIAMDPTQMSKSPIWESLDLTPATDNTAPVEPAEPGGHSPAKTSTASDTSERKQ